MNEKEIKKSILLILVVTVVIFIGFVIWFGNFLTTESAECMKSPISYYEEKSDQLCYCIDGLGWNNPRDNNLFGVVP